jgi:hypothetical protein
LKETQSQGTQHFFLGNPHGEENPEKNSSIIDFQYNAKTKDQNTKEYPRLSMRLSLLLLAIAASFKTCALDE